ncbi:GNAT family N-acetyltransferase [Variovorax paradoxus]|nr:GNAT family N-acetyltransferase [Variovorax paradoxus]
MKIEQAQPSDAPAVAAVLQEAAQWLAAGGRALWSAAEVGDERVSRDTKGGLFYLARADGAVAGVMKFELEDPYFWAEVSNGTSAFVHKLAVRRSWAKKGVSTELLAFARARARGLGLRHLRLDCMADRVGLRQVYERFGFVLHSHIQKGTSTFARYELETDR